MNKQLELELNGEKAANKIRLFLSFIFLFTTVGAFFAGTVNNIVQYYFTGLLVYCLAPLISTLIIRIYGYNSRLKYFTTSFEFIGVFIVCLSYQLSGDERYLIEGVTNHTLYAVWFVILATTILRFSPRFVIFSTSLATLLYALLFLLVLSETQTILIYSGLADYAKKELALPRIVFMLLFILIVGLILARGARYMRNIVMKSIKSENEAHQNADRQLALLQTSSKVTEDLDQAVKTINNIAVSSEDLSRDQLSSVEETSSAMEQMSASIQSISEQALTSDRLSSQNAESMERLDGITKQIEKISRDAHESGEGILERTLNGEQELETALATIKRIQEGSVQVSEIVTVINGIADKTNLLALNAAIEAARAGAEGRGFSVVADEVGKLAELSSNNAKMIEELIRGTSQDTQAGVNSIEKTVRSLQGVTEGVKNIVSLINEIYRSIREQSESARNVKEQTNTIQNIAREMKNATQEQFQGAREILKAVDSINQAADNVVKNHGRLHEAAENLSRTTTRLNKRIERFNLKDPTEAETSDTTEAPGNQEV